MAIFVVDDEIDLFSDEESVGNFGFNVSFENENETKEVK